jgi:hypothetical protein
VLSTEALVDELERRGWEKSQPTRVADCSPTLIGQTSLKSPLPPDEY